MRGEHEEPAVLLAAGAVSEVLVRVLIFTGAQDLELLLGSTLLEHWIPDQGGVRRE